MGQLEKFNSIKRYYTNKCIASCDNARDQQTGSVHQIFHNTTFKAEE